ncbi:hypothetical protein CPSG_00791 [Coccidioides posadasii str. Silveira]|uniref:Uncharacterized protein n=1 Tax=Coccidioides posadasii (strain RMSCC 757 / Silveira) TaxID=443226 RepID=E9CT82_COCPS|nr:hypothetical protein CPSG_00791 [Coccidioides posadasii str. Silveira]
MAKRDARTRKEVLFISVRDDFLRRYRGATAPAGLQSGRGKDNYALLSDFFKVGPFSEVPHRRFIAIPLDPIRR